jgi:cyclopropane fatty-acyl-phospholipid synthase-like methyltransferase
MSRAARHYDQVTEAWREWVMGEELHFGLFESGREPLVEATRALTEHLAAALEPKADLEVLDVGCGIGTPAFHLATAHGCRVLGISTSAVGIASAEARASERGLGDRVRFLLRDATNSGLPEQSFDRIFALESAHLMSDKRALLRDCFRVLRPGGKLALCDVAMVGSEGAEIAQYAMLGHSTQVAGRMRDAVHATMHRAFGSEMLAHVRVYQEAAERAGFAEVALSDLSAKTRPTLARWADNACAHWEAIAARLGPAYLDDLFLALSHMSFGWGRLGGYLTLTARRPS